jgi:hypothetical protein
MRSYKERFIYNDEDFKKVSKELSSIYESNKELNKETKKYKSELKKLK